MPVYPLVATEFWGGLLTIIFYVALITLWAFALTDLFTRKGMSGWAKAAWVFAIIFFPFLGAFFYLVTRRPTEAEIAYAERAYGEQATFIESAAGELDRLNKLRAQGAISEQEYQTLRARVVAGGGMERAA
jgi:hypothetical protein